MSKIKKFFLVFLCAIGFLFLFACFSIIRIFVFKFDSTSENIISTGYLFLYILAITFIFYQSFKAYISKPSIMNVVMVDEHGLAIKKSKTVSLVLAIIGGLIFAFTLALELGLNKVIHIFSIGVTYALMNTALAVLLISLFFHLYPRYHLPEHTKKEIE